MFCVNCQNDLDHCTCPDLKERLRKMMIDNIIIFRVCSLCGNHYATCECYDPDWTVSTNPIWRERWLGET